MELADDQFTGQQVNPDSYAPKTLKSEMFHRGKLPFDECVQISLSLTTALENLHSQGLVHRDIKPSNVIFVNGVVKLADIGLVTSVDASRSFVGTEGFVPPEGPGTPQADIYSLGKVLYEVCTGKDRQEFPELPTNLDGWPDREGLLELNAVIAKACREDPRQRYLSAQAMQRDLLLLQSGKSLARLHAAERTLAKVKRTAVAAGAVVLVLAAGLSLATIGWRQTRVERDKALQARAGEERQRKAAQSAQKIAETEREKAAESQQQSRRLLYASDMYLAQQALTDNDLGQARRLLDRHRPQLGEEDLRGWEWRYLWQLTRGTALAPLTNAPAPGHSVSFSPDGSRLAVGWGDGRVDLWDVRGRRWIRMLTETKNWPGRAVFSPDGNLLAATSATNAVSMYDLNADRASSLWRAPSGADWRVRDMEFSQDGSRLVIYASSTEDVEDGVWVVNVSSAKIESHHAAGYGVSLIARAARLSPDNQRLYLARNGGLNSRYCIQCLDLMTDRQLWQSQPIPDLGITALAISPDGRLLASGSGYADPTIRVWDAVTGRPLARLEGHTGWVSKLVFTKDGTRLLSSAADQTIRFWDTTTWTEAKALRGHRDEVWSVALSETAHLIASASKDGDLMLWNDLGNKADDTYLRLPDDLDRVIPMDGARVILVRTNVSPELFDVGRGVSLGLMPTLGPSSTVCGFGSNWLCRWDGTNQILVDQWNGSQFARIGAVTLDSGARPVKALFSRASQLVAWNDATTNSIFLDSLSTPGRTIQLKSQIPGLRPYFFNTDGKYLAALKPEPGSLCVWNVDTGENMITVPQGCVDVAFADGGRSLVVFGLRYQDENEMMFCHLDGKPQSLRGKTNPGSLAVSPDGQLVAATMESGVVRLCNAVTGELIGDLHGHLNGAFGVAFSPDGRRLVSASGGRRAVKLWDVGTRQELLNLSGAGSLLWQALWSADGDTIIAGHWREAWQAWRAPSWEEIAAVEAKEKAENKQP
jgi:WD40 repeat protein